eukprot:CAMPEP_0184383984 /NCGR_PEP_ID=MMETSP0007-20130409/7559_1 /TAXON_ID=97485 /ORGANISM="Prymnesium parvum, Strain Texoma1" /LENGTH=141 /DNA_ID=CAMNT_0026730681 /DNA_START=112 /DNA_END=536 /DNA_ORIENTATION=+
MPKNLSFILQPTELPPAAPRLRWKEKLGKLVRNQTCAALGTVGLSRLLVDLTAHPVGVGIETRVAERALTIAKRKMTARYGTQSLLVATDRSRLRESETTKEDGMTKWEGVRHTGHERATSGLLAYVSRHCRMHAKQKAWE